MVDWTSGVRHLLIARRLKLVNKENLLLRKKDDARKARVEVSTFNIQSSF